MIEWKSLQEAIGFFLQENGNLIMPSLWYKYVSMGDGRLLLLQELLDNGQATSEGYYVIVSYEEICGLEYVDQLLLELPAPYNQIIRIDSVGSLHEQDFRYRYGFFEHALGEKLNLSRQGAVLKGNQEDYLLSGIQLDLCNCLDAFNALPASEKTARVNLLKFNEIKSLAREAGAVLDSYLEQENVVVPQNISLQLDLEEEILHIAPGIDEMDAQKFGHKFTRFPTVRDIYNFQDKTGKRNRVVFSDQQKEELGKIKKYSRTGGELKQMLLTSPQEIFNPDIIDLDSFSDRVVEIGCYEPRYYPFIRPNNQNQWIPGIVVEKSPQERSEIVVENQNELESLKQAYNEARADQGQTVSFKGESLAMDKAEKLIALAERQLLDLSKPVNKLNGRQKVLIIKENIDDVEYDNYETEAQYNVVHTYTAPKNLLKDITILDHQKEGIAWLQSLYNLGCSGALLADDMGLGKTLQVLSFIDWHANITADNGKPYLVVAPVALLENWADEYGKFFDNDSYEILNCRGIYLEQSLQRLEDSNTLGRIRLVLTSYETLRRHQLRLCQLDWAVVILDEAQKIKTPGTLVTNAAKALKADFKIAVTGTPVENSFVDLWCIMDFAVPGLLGSAKDFIAQYQTPLASEETDVVKLGERLRQQIGDQIKRRLKEQVLTGLPEKNLLFVDRIMPPVQFERYQRIINHAQGTSTQQNNSGFILETINKLKNVSDHPYLLDDKIDTLNVDELIDSSAKLQITIEILERIQDKGEKVILFAERRATQRLLARVLYEKFNLQRVSIINGQTPASGSGNRESRKGLVDVFQQLPGFNAIILSPLAAGTGLTITEANHVIHYSRHWNPAKEEQATDRVYRIGQQKPVFVYFPKAVAADFKSFDVVLHELLEQKRELSSASLFPTTRVEVKREELYSAVMGAN